MNASYDSGSDFNMTQRTVIAKRQLHASLGALVVLALVAVAATLTMRVPTVPQVAASETPHYRVIKAAVRQTPSQTMQATDDTKSDRGS